MIAEQDARKLVSTVIDTLQKNHGEPPAPPEDGLLAESVLAILSNGSSKKTAGAALKKLQDGFVDWNEARVSTVHEVAACVGAAPEDEEKARSVRALLRAVFREDNEIGMGFLREASPSDAREFVEKIRELEPTVAYRILMEVLGHACVPVTEEVARVCKRLDLVREDYDEEQTQKRLERIIAKAQMPAFFHVVLAHAQKTCLVEKPKCDQCALLKECAWVGQ